MIDAAEIAPMVTWGTNPEDVAPISGHVPDPAGAATAERREGISKVLAYMAPTPGTRLSEIPVDRVFIGSCADGRIKGLRSAAAVAAGRTVYPGVERPRPHSSPSAHEPPLRGRASVLCLPTPERSACRS